MNFAKHSNLEGQHAFLSASGYHWINYSEEKIADAYAKYRAAQRGTALHAFAAQCIKLGQRLPKSQKTLNMYVNDAIGYKMTPEQILYYSPNCFGTADAISFRKDILRIHDLKTGETPTHMEQLMVYAALFCLEYDYKPNEIEMELRIYQNDIILYHKPTIEDIFPIMDRIVTFDKIHYDVDIEAARAEIQGTRTDMNFGENYIYAEAIISAALYAREKYKGTGTPDFFCTPHLVNVMLLARDMNGRRIYTSRADLAAALNVGELYTAEQFEGRARMDGEGKQHKLLGIFVNLADYTVGSTKGGEITRFDQFDIDFNQQKYLIETRLSGALTRVYSAIALEEPVPTGTGGGSGTNP